jgi:hypothetical protein
MDAPFRYFSKDGMSCRRHGHEVADPVEHKYIMP